MAWGFNEHGCRGSIANLPVPSRATTISFVFRMFGGFFCQQVIKGIFLYSLYNDVRASFSNDIMLHYEGNRRFFMNRVCSCPVGSLKWVLFLVKGHRNGPRINVTIFMTREIYVGKRNYTSIIFMGLFPLHIEQERKHFRVVPMRVLSVDTKRRLIPTIIEVFFLFHIRSFSIFIANSGHNNTPNIFENIRFRNKCSNRVKKIRARIGKKSNLLLASKINISP